MNNAVAIHTAALRAKSAPQMAAAAAKITSTSSMLAFADSVASCSTGLPQFGELPASLSQSSRLQAPSPAAGLRAAAARRQPRATVHEFFATTSELAFASPSTTVSLLTIAHQTPCSLALKLRPQAPRGE